MLARPKRKRPRAAIALAVAQGGSNVQYPMLNVKVENLVALMAYARLYSVFACSVQRAAVFWIRFRPLPLSCICLRLIA
jgi:hypothetical protein